jgi:hypothetical protein
MAYLFMVDLMAVVIWFVLGSSHIAFMISLLLLPWNVTPLEHLCAMSMVVLVSIPRHLEFSFIV